MSSKKVGRGTPLKSQSRELVYNLRSYFEEERRNGGPLISVSKVIERVAAALKIGKTSVKKITREKCPGDLNEPTTSVLSTPGKSRKRMCVKTNFDSFQSEAIRRHIYKYYERKEYPTLKALLASLKEENLFVGQKTSLSLVLKKLGFRWKKSQVGGF